ncbi:hypothetical protein ABK040_004548 [Willaertia magna]
MFKKVSVRSSQSHLIKLSERKKLLKQIQSTYPHIPLPVSSSSSSTNNDEENDNTNNNTQQQEHQANNNNPWSLLLPLNKNIPVHLHKAQMILNTGSSIGQTMSGHGSSSNNPHNANNKPTTLAKHTPNKKKKQTTLIKQQIKANQEILSFTLITVNQLPMFFTIPQSNQEDDDEDNNNNEDNNSENQFIPTLFALHIAPNLLPVLFIGQPVTTFILQGADLMKPGVSKTQTVSLQLQQVLENQLGLIVGGYSNVKFMKNQLRSIQIHGNPMPFAVGKMLMNESEFKNSEKGKCMEVLHYFNDYLWQYGVTHVVNSGDDNNKNLVPLGFFNDHIDRWKIEVVGENEKQQDDEEQTVEDLNQLVESKDEKVEEEKKEEEIVLTEEELMKGMDDKIEQIFLLTLKNLYGTDDLLPVEVGTIYTKMIELDTLLQQQSSSNNNVIDIKKSSYKKFSKFIKQMQKENVIKTKENVKGISSITVVHRDNEKYKNIKEIKDIKSLLENSSLGGNKGDNSKNQIEILPLKKVSHTHFLPIFKTTDKEILYTEKEVKDRLVNYCQENKLIENGKVKLNELLLKLFKKNQHNLNDKIAIPPLVEQLQKEMNDYYLLSYGDQQQNEKIIKGQCPGIQIDVEFIMGKKVITKVNGLQLVIGSENLDCNEFNELTKKLKSVCSASIKTNTAIGGSAMNPMHEPEMLIQGNHALAIQQVLVQSYGFPAKFIFINDKTSKKKKK